ncbi:SdrD B-like domain-containing protein [Demequina litorisediminis]|nr:SdrD B-like domain-containing protein [Demequina litorisediminis]
MTMRTPSRASPSSLLDAATGKVLKTTTTNSEGRYLFDLLEAGEYRVKFTLTPAQAAIYTLTQADVGANDRVDSDAARATGETGVISLTSTSPALVSAASYTHGDVQALLGIDPTWDAGVVLRPGEVSVGDFVWLDENKDGRQDAGEPGIPGVVLVLTGPDGQPVTDVDGRLVTPQTTDANGRYLFTALPVLDPGQSYTVSIDRTASERVLRLFSITLAQQGDREGDSSSWTASSEGLTVAGESDLTLDFGFVRTTVPDPDVTTVPTPEPEPSTPASPDPSPTPSVTPTPGATTPMPDPSGDEGTESSGGDAGGDGGLSSTGPEFWLTVIGAAALLTAGAVLVVARARRG